MEPAPSRLSSPNSSSIAQIGNYNLVKTIGKGQFGSVKLAVHSLTGEKVRHDVLVNLGNSVVIDFSLTVF